MASSSVIACAFCGRPIDRPTTAYQKVEGWDRHRRAGGTNALTLRRPLPEYACEGCIAIQKAGAGQESLL